MACWLVVLLFMVIATAHLVSQSLAFLQHCNIPGPLCQSISACFKDLQRLQRSSEIQGDPRGWCFNTFNQGSSAWTCPSQVLSFALLLCWSLLALHSLPSQRSNGVFTRWGAPGENRDDSEESLLSFRIVHMNYASLACCLVFELCTESLQIIMSHCEP